MELLWEREERHGGYLLRLRWLIAGICSMWALTMVMAYNFRPSSPVADCGGHGYIGFQDDGTILMSGFTFDGGGQYSPGGRRLIGPLVSIQPAIIPGCESGTCE